MPRVIAFYLPQFHPIPENDEWWGKGFTEWTSVTRARPLFDGHYQPHVPADLGYNDLRDPAARQSQAELAHRYGIEGFCYYHYWFAGRRLLQHPFEDVLHSGKPGLPFCLCWANQSWTGVWHNAPDRILIEQTYPGPSDHEAHFTHLLPAFRDDRYIRVDGRPLFLIFDPRGLPIPDRTLLQWRDMADRAGLGGLFIIAIGHLWRDSVLETLGFDGTVTKLAPPRIDAGQHPTFYDHEIAIDELVYLRAPGENDFPCVSPNWDNTPRSGRRGVVLHNSSPQLFRRNLLAALEAVADEPEDRQLIFIKAWNERGEGNHLEPNLRFGHGFLEQILAITAPR